MGSAGGWRWLAWLMVGALGALLLAGSASAQQRTDYLIRLLNNSSSFRVRAKAALGLSKLDDADKDKVGRALAAALEDDHPAVRTAAAAALERLGDPSNLDALRSARKDPERKVRRAVRRAIEKLERIARTRPRREQGGDDPSSGGGGEARFYVGVGEPGTKDDAISDQMLREARSYLRERVGKMDGVELAPNGESSKHARRVIQRKDLTGYFVDSSVVKVEDDSDGTRVVVSVILNSYPGRNMRGMLQGAARVPGAHGEQARQTALEGALRSALRRLPEVMSSTETN